MDKKLGFYLIAIFFWLKSSIAYPQSGLPTPVAAASVYVTLSTNFNVSAKTGSVPIIDLLTNAYNDSPNVTLLDPPPPFDLNAYLKANPGVPSFPVIVQMPLETYVKGVVSQEIGVPQTGIIQ